MGEGEGSRRCLANRGVGGGGDFTDGVGVSEGGLEGSRRGIS